MSGAHHRGASGPSGGFVSEGFDAPRWVGQRMAEMRQRPDQVARFRALPLQGRIIGMGVIAPEVKETRIAVQCSIWLHEWIASGGKL